MPIEQVHPVDLTPDAAAELRLMALEEGISEDEALRRVIAGQAELNRVARSLGVPAMARPPTTSV